MNKLDLKLKLDELKVPESDYSLDGELLPMRTILTPNGYRWATFDYDEHGNVKDKKEFATESQACEHMYKRLKYLQEWRKKYNIK